MVTADTQSRGIGIDIGKEKIVLKHLYFLYCGLAFKTRKDHFDAILPYTNIQNISTVYSLIL